MSGTQGPTPYGRRRPLFRLFGFEVYVPLSAWIGIALIAFVNAPAFIGSGGMPATLAFAGGLYVTVLVHELAHAIVARATGHTVYGIELGILGGATSYAPEVHPNPKHELRVAAAGPLASLAVGALCNASSRVLDTSVSHDAAVVLAAIGFMSTFLAFMNLLPSAPLDGGHVCEALIWRITGSRPLGMRVTSVLGYLIGAVMTATGFAAPNSALAPMLVFLGFMLVFNSAALWRASQSRYLP